ncbi:unnamed protein product [Linum trigynum]|uniref:DUF4283 domain-containing protein n=1 Tax=Linum trigynum TaxID=586398 RepID=A0AAV2DUS6_9ROSI
MIVWVRLPALKVHFYHHEALTSLGNLIGRTIKLNYHTINQQRRKFTRLAVEIDMTKPLVPRIFLDITDRKWSMKTSQRCASSVGRLATVLVAAQCFNLQRSAINWPSSAINLRPSRRPLRKRLKQALGHGC